MFDSRILPKQQTMLKKADMDRAETHLNVYHVMAAFMLAGHPVAQ